MPDPTPAQNDAVATNQKIKALKTATAAARVETKKAYAEIPQNVADAKEAEACLATVASAVGKGLKVQLPTRCEKFLPKSDPSSTTKK